MFAGWRALLSPRIKGPIQTLVMGQTWRCVCMDGFWGSNLS